MNLSTAWRSLGAATDHVPVEAIDWLLANWETASAGALQVIARCTHDPEGVPDTDVAAAYFLLHVCAEKRDTRAFPLLCTLCKHPAGIDDILGDASLIVLPSIIVSTFDGNTAALLSIITSPEASVMTKSCTFGAIAYLAAEGRADRPAIEALLESFPQTSGDDPLAGWDGWAMAVALLGHENLMPLVRQAYAREDIADLLPDQGEVEDVFRLAREEPDPLTIFDRKEIRPVSRPSTRWPARNSS